MSVIIYHTLIFPAEKKTAIGVVDGILDEAGELVSQRTLTSMYVHVHVYDYKAMPN